MSDHLQRLQPILRDVLDLPSLEISRQDSALTIDGWDSLAHLSIIALVEREFDVHFALGELEELKNIGDMIDLIIQKHAMG
jgi:acyl carrier protein